MAGRFRQRTVYAATAVAVLTLVAGFAIASITAFNLTTSSQGSGSVVTKGTQYTCVPAPANCVTSTLMVGSTTAATCGASNTPPQITGTSPTVNIVLTVASSGTTCTGGDFAEEFSFTSTVGTASCFTTTTTCSDTFLVSTVVGGTASNAELGTAGFTESTSTPSGTITVNVQLYVDYQATADPGITSVSIVVNGNY